MVTILWLLRWPLLAVLAAPWDVWPDVVGTGAPAVRMAARRRKALVVRRACHEDVHARRPTATTRSTGEPDFPRLLGLADTARPLGHDDALKGTSNSADL